MTYHVLPKELLAVVISPYRTAILLSQHERPGPAVFLAEVDSFRPMVRSPFIMARAVLAVLQQ